MTEMEDGGGRTLRTVEALIAAGLAGDGEQAGLAAVAARYAIALTPEVVAAIRRTGPDGPIGRQYLPDPRELATAPEERADPIGDAAHSPLPGLVHRYPDRVLLKPLLACPVYCRFCFRREAVGPGRGALSETELDAALGYIAADPGIWEVILTGGDPLLLSPRRLKRILGRLGAIGHVRALRVHSRVPVADPERVSPALVAALAEGAGETPVWLSIHCNRAEELTPAARTACRRLAAAGVPLLAQTVLLKGVNDDAEALAALFRALVANRIRPYYLHHPDLAPGTAHFRVSVADGRALMRALRGRVSGVCLPTYVLDIPGGYGKVPLGPDYVGAGTVEDPFGDRHAYPPGVPSSLRAGGQADRVRRASRPDTPKIRP